VVDGDTLAAPVITRDTVAVETDAFLATSRIPMSYSVPVGSSSGDNPAIPSQIPFTFQDYCQIQIAVQHLNLQSITFPVF